MPIRYLFFDVGYTLVDENAVWEARCREQADMPEARALGLTAGDLYREIQEASRHYLPQYRAVVKKYGFTQTAPFRGEMETLYPEAPAVLVGSTVAPSLVAASCTPSPPVKRPYPWAFSSMSFSSIPKDIIPRSSDSAQFSRSFLVYPTTVGFPVVPDDTCTLTSSE